MHTHSAHALDAYSAHAELAREKRVLEEVLAARGARPGVDAITIASGDDAETATPTPGEPSSDEAPDASDDGNAGDEGDESSSDAAAVSDIDIEA